jgi:hypothetical protein
MAVVSYEYGTQAIKVMFGILILLSSFLRRISVSAKYRKIIRRFPCHWAMRAEQLRLKCSNTNGATMSPAHRSRKKSAKLNLTI